VAARRRPKPKKASSAKRGLTWAQVVRLALKFPGVETGECFNTPALYVRKKFLARLKEDGESVAIKVDFADRDILLELDPKAFYLTDHYRAYPMFLVRMKHVRIDMFERIFEGAWRKYASKKQLAERA
jgi:hypothetical protein